MLNAEKYRDEILDGELGAFQKALIIYGYNVVEGFTYDKLMQWLLSEYKEPILDEVEREYLSAVCRPYKVEHILKAGIINNKVWLSVGVSSITIGIEELKLPLFEKNTMYKGMEVGKYYTPQELGIKCRNNPNGEIKHD